MVIDDDGTTLHAMTYNGSMPGPLMVVHEGDYVELTLINPDTNSMAHNIDFHAATGALGGGELTLVNPGEQVTLRFKATRTGTFVYHCAPGGPMIPWHVVSGMSGAIMVLPRDGLKNEQGRAAQIRQGVLCRRARFLHSARREGQTSRPTSPPAMPMTTCVEVMRRLTPTHVVFNGKVGCADRRECHDGQGRRDRADRPFAGQPRYAGRI